MPRTTRGSPLANSRIAVTRRPGQLATLVQVSPSSWDSTRSLPTPVHVLVRVRSVHEGMVLAETGSMAGVYDPMGRAWADGSRRIAAHACASVPGAGRGAYTVVVSVDADALCAGPGVLAAVGVGGVAIEVRADRRGVLDDRAGVDDARSAGTL